MNANRFFTLETESRNQFYQVPKIFMMEESTYFKMSAMAKLTYGVLADRNSLSISNGWIDDERRVFFLFNQKALCAVLGVKDPKTVRRYLKELESADLLYRESQGDGMVDRLYLLQVDVDESQSYQLMGQNALPLRAKCPTPPRAKCPTNNTNTINNTDINNNKKNREGEPFSTGLSEVEESIEGDELVATPAIIPYECKNELDKYFIGRFKKERSFYNCDFNNGLYYNAFADALVKTQLQDSVEILTMKQYPYFTSTLKKMIKPLEMERKLLGW